MVVLVGWVTAAGAQQAVVAARVGSVALAEAASSPRPKTGQVVTVALWAREELRGGAEKAVAWEVGKLVEGLAVGMTEASKEGD